MKIILRFHELEINKSINPMVDRKYQLFSSSLDLYSSSSTVSQNYWWNYSSFGRSFTLVRQISYHATDEQWHVILFAVIIRLKLRTRQADFFDGLTCNIHGMHGMMALWRIVNITADIYDSFQQIWCKQFYNALKGLNPSKRMKKKSNLVSHNRHNITSTLK